MAIFGHTGRMPVETKEEASYRQEGGVVHLSGRLDAEGSAQLWRTIFQRSRKKHDEVKSIDASGLTYCDGAGIALLFALSRQTKASIDHLAPEFQKLLDQFSSDSFDRPVDPPRKISAIEKLGMGGAEFGRDLYDQVVFLGRMSVISVQTFFRPSLVRWGDVWRVFEKAGVNAVGIVGMIGFLMGLIMAFQSAIPLKQFGVDVFVINLVALAMFRELGAIMTAILLAGRSGSAFAAEIGTMKVNEELNALKTMGIDDARFLVAPRMIAGIIATPLLSIYANLMGLLGGFIVMMSFGFPFAALYRQVTANVEINDIVSGLVKSVVFGVLVAGIGCLRGLQTKSGATAVGDSTTRAVVSGIVLIVITDAIFAVIFYVLNF